MSLQASSELKIENDWSSERQQACLIDRDSLASLAYP